MPKTKAIIFSVGALLSVMAVAAFGEPASAQMLCGGGDHGNTTETSNSSGNQGN